MKQHEFEDELHSLARKANKSGLSVAAIADAFAGRASFANKYLLQHNAVEYPRIFSDETAKRRITKSWKKYTAKERREIEQYGSTAARVKMFTDDLFDLDIPADVIANCLETYATLARRAAA
jgi:hypothetical protein